MASSLIGSLRVALSLGTAEFEAGANKAASVARTKAKEIESSFSGAKAAIAGLFAAFTVGVLTEQVKKSLEYAGSLAEVSRTLGVTTKDLQTFRYAATQTGVAQDQLEVGLRRLTVSIGKAELGSKAQQKAFGALGITVDQLKGKTTGDVFRMMSDSLSKVTDRSQRAAIEMTLMGRSGSTLDNLLAPGAKRLNELADAAQRLGIVLSDQQIQGAEETAHKLAAVKEVLSAQIAGVVANNAQAILSLSSALATLTSSIVKFLGSNPQLALGIIGALLGGRVGGLPGAVIGGAAGALLGGRVAQDAADSNTDLAFRTQQFNEARQRYAAAHQSIGGGPAMSVGGIQVAGGAPNTLDAARELTKQAGLLRNAIAQSKAPKATPTPGTDLPQFLGGGDGKGKGGSTAAAPQDRTEQDEFLFAQQQRQLDLEIIEAKKSLSHDVSDQAELALQALAIQTAMKNADIDHKVEQAKRDAADGKITQSTLAQIETDAGIEKGKQAELDSLQRKAILDQRDEQLLQQSITLDQHGYDLKAGMLQKAADLATTAAARRKLELELLELQYKEKRIILDRIIAESKDPLAVAQAQQDRAALDQQHALDKQGVIQQTRGPLEEWAATAPHDAAMINEALQSIGAKSLDGLSDAITGVITGTESLKSAFHNLAASILADLIQMTIKMLLFKALQAAFGGGSFNYGGGDALGSFASSSLPTFASGGFVSGEGGPKSDSIPAMLSNGEYVMSAEAVRKFGTRFLDSINGGSVPHKKGGGFLGALRFLSPAAFFASSGPSALQYLSPVGIGASLFGLKAFANGGLVNGIPIARASYGSGASVGNDNGPGRSSIVLQQFDLRGAVMTEDLVRQMNESSQHAAEMGAQMGVSRMVDLNRRTFGKALKS